MDTESPLKLTFPWQPESILENPGNEFQGRVLPGKQLWNFPDQIRGLNGKIGSLRGSIGS
jgi:hypothetical protein